MLKPLKSIGLDAYSTVMMGKQGVFLRNVYQVRTMDGAVIDYIRFGSGSPLVIILGLGDGLRSVKDISILLLGYFRPYSKKHQVIVMSRRRPLDKEHSLSDVARDYSYAFKQLGLSKVHLWGNSAGGILAQQIALEYPNLIHSLILSRTYGRATKRFNTMIQTIVEEAQNARFDRVISSFIEYSKVQKIIGKLNPLIYIFYKRFLYYGEERVYAILQSLIDVDNITALKRLKCPILVMTEDNDTLVYDEMQKDLAESLPSATVSSFKNRGYGHFSTLSSRRNYQKTILSFLEGVTTRHQAKTKSEIKVINHDKKGI